MSRRRGVAVEPSLPLDLPEAPRDRAPGRTRSSIPNSVPTADLFDHQRPDPPPAPPPQAVALPPPTWLSSEEVSLQRVDPQGFRPNERNDSWLYWLTDREQANAALRDGLSLDATNPLLLRERIAVLPQLVRLSEEPDLAPSTLMVLRLRRLAITHLLGPDPDGYRLPDNRLS